MRQPTSAFLAPLLGLAVLVSAGSQPSAFAERSIASPCHAGGYTSTAVKCIVVPASGKFSVRLPGTKVRLVGVGSAATHGTTIAITRVPAPAGSPHGVAIKVQASGPFKPLKLNKGKLYRFNHTTATVQRVKSITRSGIYIVVP
ncbi:MAG TPA: hypothetical protein VKX16_07270 [Chloroflexota bacterium]|nr:hypothetical protein [Chloroflexota bacterium]